MMEQILISEGALKLDVINRLLAVFHFISNFLLTQVSF